MTEIYLLTEDDCESILKMRRLWRMHADAKWGLSFSCLNIDGLIEGRKELQRRRHERS